MRSTNLSASDYQLLRQTIHTQNPNSALGKRCRCIMLHSYGLSVNELMETFEVNRRTIYNWLNRYQKGGIPALVDKPGRGQKCPPVDNELLETITQRAEEVGLPQAYREVKQQGQPVASYDTIRRRLNSLRTH
jgi:transposase